MPAPYLSIVIPALNEEHRLPGALEQLFSFLQDQSYSSEVILVENGSKDRTLQIAQSFAERFPQMRIFQNQQRGKGLAVQRGMLEARG